MTPEQRATVEVRETASSTGLRLFRNNNGACKDETGRVIRFGLGNESKRINDEIKFGDYIGVTPIIITPEMVGKVVGVFTNIEVKPKGTLDATLRKAKKPKTREAAQLKAIELVRSFGGFAGFCTSGEDLNNLIKEFFKGISK